MTRKHPLIVFYTRCVLTGFLLAAVFTAALIWLDVARLGHLVAHVEGGFLAAFLLWFFNGIAFSGAQTAVSVLLMAERRDSGAGGARVSLPVPVRAD